VSMMKVLAVMTYFQISLPTHNWDSAFFLAVPLWCAAAFSIIFCGRRLRLWSQRRGGSVVIIWPLTRGELVNTGENV
ncbi:hypothetical protein, partial [Aeromonas caviae]|uniref:hypothetical protein n=1 Tax=Aeromonas caviae TaxID=648 RepID=UPI002B478554